MLTSARALGTWGVVVAASRLRGVRARDLLRVRDAVYGGAGAVPVRGPDARQTPPMRVPGLTARPWHDPAAFPSAAALTAARAEIAAEAAEAHAAGRFVARPAARVVEGAWSTRNLRYLGASIDDHRRRYPATARVLAALADVSTLGLVYFCALAPGTVLAPHGRHTNAALRLQLNLRGDGPCALRVGGEARAYAAGECLAVDDSFVTDEWNRGRDTRLALVVDVWHPELAPAEIAALDVVSRWSLGARRGRRHAP
jgi:aspartyl/asparaginyl beta-hydroxylase (cupin superfamily)